MKAARRALRKHRNAWGLLAALLCVGFASPLAAGAAEDIAAAIPRDDPQEMLRVATDRLLKITREARSYAQDDPERYYAAVYEVLDEVIDMHYFARSVMATYASARLYQSLETDAERAAFRARIARFEKAIRSAFMVKYADALLRFEGERIDISDEPSGYDDPGRASVQQLIYDRDGTHYRVQYSLRRGDSGDWLVRNVIVEDVNLGQIYRSQFAEAVERNRGDVDYVVDHWVDLMSARETEGAGQ